MYSAVSNKISKKDIPPKYIRIRHCQRNMKSFQIPYHRNALSDAHGHRSHTIEFTSPIHPMEISSHDPAFPRTLPHKYHSPGRVSTHTATLSQKSQMLLRNKEHGLQLQTRTIPTPQADIMNRPMIILGVGDQPPTATSGTSGTLDLMYLPRVPLRPPLPVLIPPLPKLPFLSPRPHFLSPGLPCPLTSFPLTPYPLTPRPP